MSGLTCETNYEFQVEAQYSDRWHDYAQVSANHRRMLIGKPYLVAWRRHEQALIIAMMRRDGEYPGYLMTDYHVIARTMKAGGARTPAPRYPPEGHRLREAGLPQRARHRAALTGMGASKC